MRDALLLVAMFAIVIILGLQDRSPEPCQAIIEQETLEKAFEKAFLKMTHALERGE